MTELRGIKELSKRPSDAGEIFACALAMVAIMAQGND